jgi:putative flavoprotein involved in K+ transport
VRIAETWRFKRWDSFTLVTPNWGLQLPGFPYDGDQPHDFATRDEVVDYLERYASSFDAPVRTGVRISAVRPASEGCYIIETDTGEHLAANVVVATGGYHSPVRPRFAADIPARIMQLDVTEYRNPDRLPDGAVLVVGSGQSGAQVAEELFESVRTTYIQNRQAINWSS